MHLSPGGHAPRVETSVERDGACELQGKNGSTYATREALKNTDVWERLL